MRAFSILAIGLVSIGFHTLVLSGQETKGQPSLPEVFLVCGHKQPQPCASAPKAMSTPDPAESREAGQLGMRGVVKMEVVVGVDGKVRETHITRSANRDLDELATRRIQLWKFKPGAYQGKPVPVRILVEFNF